MNVIKKILGFSEKEEKMGIELRDVEVNQAQDSESGGNILKIVAANVENFYKPAQHSSLVNSKVRMNNSNFSISVSGVKLTQNQTNCDGTNIQSLICFNVTNQHFYLDPANPRASSGVSHDNSDEDAPLTDGNSEQVSHSESDISENEDANEEEDREEPDEVLVSGKKISVLILQFLGNLTDGNGACIKDICKFIRRSSPGQKNLRPLVNTYLKYAVKKKVINKVSGSSSPPKYSVNKIRDKQVHKVHRKRKTFSN